MVLKFFIYFSMEKVMINYGKWFLKSVGTLNYAFTAFDPQKI